MTHHTDYKSIGYKQTEFLSGVSEAVDLPSKSKASW